jgi:hypothetical protein
VTSPITARARSKTLGTPSSSPYSLAPTQTVPVSFASSFSSSSPPPPPQQQQQQQYSPPLSSSSSSSAPAAALFSPPSRALGHTRKPGPCPRPEQEQREPGKPKHALRAWGAGSVCSVHLPELREGDMAPGAAEKEAAMLGRLRAAAGGAWAGAGPAGKGRRCATEPAPSNSTAASPMTPWTAERKPAHAAGGRPPLLRVLAAAAAAGDGGMDLTFSSEASSSQAEEAAVNTPAAAPATAAAALPAAALPYLYSPPLKVKTATRQLAASTHLRPATVAAAASSSLSASMPAPLSAAAGAGGGRLGQRKGLSRSTGAAPSISRWQGGRGAHHSQEEEEGEEEERSLSAAFLPTSSTAATSASATSGNAFASFACCAPISWTGIRVGSAASRKLVLRNCRDQGSGPCTVTATIAPSGPTTGLVAFMVEMAGEGSGVGGLPTVVVTFRPGFPGMHRATLCLALSSGRAYEIELVGSAHAAHRQQRQRRQRRRQVEEQDEGSDPLALSGASLAGGGCGGVFFAGPVLDFGRRRVGSVVVELVQLSNTLNVPQSVLIEVSVIIDLSGVRANVLKMDPMRMDVPEKMWRLPYHLTFSLCHPAACRPPLRRPASSHPTQAASLRPPAHSLRASGPGPLRLHAPGDSSAPVDGSWGKGSGPSGCCPVSHRARAAGGGI